MCLEGLRHRCPMLLLLFVLLLCYWHPRETTLLHRHYSIDTHLHHLQCHRCDMTTTKVDYFEEEEKNTRNPPIFTFLSLNSRKCVWFYSFLLQFRHWKKKHVFVCVYVYLGKCSLKVSEKHFPRLNKKWIESYYITPNTPFNLLNLIFGPPASIIILFKPQQRKFHPI